MAESSQEKTEEATPKRLREARKKGQVAKSKDLTTVFEMIVVFAVMALTMGMMGNEMRVLMQRLFELSGKPGGLNANDLMEAGKMSTIAMIKVTAPIMLAGFVAAALIGFLQVGAIFTLEPLTPKPEKLNPIEGMKNMFKVVTFIELIKNIAKLGVVFYLAYITIDKFLREILLSSQVGVMDAMTMTGSIVSSFFIKVALVFLVIAFIDLGVQRWNYMKNMRMSKDEVKREYKQDEGDPHIKSERRHLHREMVFGNTRQNVKKADAVVSNPIHVAIAIQYDRKEMAAPEVTAKGQRKMAEMILQIAREENVPIIRNIPLAWSLLKLDEGAAIPEDLYEPVAEVLSLVYELKERGQMPSETPQPEQAPQPKTRPDTFNPLG